MSQLPPWRGQEASRPQPIVNRTSLYVNVYNAWSKLLKARGLTDGLCGTNAIKAGKAPRPRRSAIEMTRQGPAHAGAHTLASCAFGWRPPPLRRRLSRARWLYLGVTCCRRRRCSPTGRNRPDCGSVRPSREHCRGTRRVAGIDEPCRHLVRGELVRLLHRYPGKLLTLRLTSGEQPSECRAKRYRKTDRSSHRRAFLGASHKDICAAFELDAGDFDLRWCWVKPV